MKQSELVVELLLSTNDLDRTYPSGKYQTPLSFAAEKGDVWLAQGLLSLRVNVNAIDKTGSYGRTALISALSPPVERSDYILQPTTWAESQLDLPWSPKRITWNSVSVSQRRIQNGQSPIRYPDHTDRYRAYQKEKAQYEARYRATGSPYMRILNLLISHGANLELCDRISRSPLIYAVCGGSVQAAQILLDSGAKVNGPDGLPSPLFHATANGDLQMVHLLLEYKANTLPRSTGCPWTPLLIAAKNGHFNVVEILLAHPVKKPHLNCKVTTWEPLRDAAKRGHARVVQTPINYHKCARPHQSLGEEGLFWAAYGGWERVFNLLLDAGAPLSGSCESLDGIPLLGGGFIGSKPWDHHEATEHGGGRSRSPR